MFQETVQLVLPIFIIIGLGYLSGFFGLIKKDVGNALGTFCITILVPVLIFRTLSTANLGGISPFNLWGAYYVGLFANYILAGLIVRYFFKREARAAVVAGFTAGFSNLALLGIPLVTSLLGTEALIPVSLIIAIHLPSVTAVSVLHMSRAVVVDGYEEARPTREVILGALKNLLANPIIIGIMLGLIWNFGALDLPAAADTVVDYLARSASPIALFAVGMSLTQYGVRGTLMIGSVLSVLKIIVMPLMVFLLATHVFNLSPLWVAVVTLAAACPSGVNSYLFAVQFGTGHGMSANSITITTFVSIFSVSGWLWFLNSMGY